MIITTTSTVEGKRISEYLGLVYGEQVNGIDFLRDIGASIRNVFGGRSSGYEEEIIQTRKECMEEMEKRARELGADAVVGVKFEYEFLGAESNMVFLHVAGTAVRLRQE